MTYFDKIFFSERHNSELISKSMSNKSSSYPELLVPIKELIKTMNVFRFIIFGMIGISKKVEIILLTHHCSLEQ